MSPYAQLISREWMLSVHNSFPETATWTHAMCSSKLQLCLDTESTSCVVYSSSGKHPSLRTPHPTQHRVLLNIEQEEDS